MFPLTKHMFQFLHFLTNNCFFVCFVCLFVLFYSSHPNGMRSYVMVLICISLVTYNVENLLVCSLPFVCLGENAYSNFLPNLKLDLYSFSFLLHTLRTVHLVTTEGNFRKVVTGDLAFCLLLVCPATVTTTATPVTLKRGSVWYA